jgi:uncharacterized membrane protein YbhN (UPF0104 family)
VAATAIVLALPRLLGRERSARAPASERTTGKLRTALQFIENSVGQGVGDGVELLRRRSAGVIVGSVGTMAFDLAVLGVCFRAFHHSPPVGVLVLGYLIGQLGGNVPVPGGIGGLDGGLIATFALYNQPLAATAAAVLVYHAIALWVPGLIGSVAFVRLRATLRRESQPAAICMPLAEPVEVITLPTTAG